MRLHVAAPPDRPVRGYLGLGSNVGDRLGNLHGARDALAAGHVSERIEVVAWSSVYETEPQGEIRDQPDFLNACVAIETDLGPEELLAACKSLERRLGRPEGGGPRHGPRPIDVDVLLFGDVEHRSRTLTIPHPDLLSRRFVLEPLLELDPGLALPDGTPLAEALRDIEGQRVERAGSLQPR